MEKKKKANQINRGYICSFKDDPVRYSFSAHVLSHPVACFLFPGFQFNAIPGKGGVGGIKQSGLCHLFL